MPFVPVDNCFKVEYIMSLYGVPCVCVVHIDNNVDVLPATPDDCVDNVAFAWTHVMNSLSEDLAFVRTIVTDISAVDGPQAMTTAHSTNGSETAHALPPQNALVYTWYTAERSRKGRGRSFVPGIPVDAVSSGRLTDAAVTTYNGNATGFLGQLASPGEGVPSTPLVVVSKTTNPGFFNRVNSGLVRAPIRSQRRREEGRS